MGFFNRFQGVFFNPKPTFQAVADKPVWVDALVLLIIVSALFAYVSAPFAYQDSLKAFKDNVKLQDQMGKERFDQMIRGMEHPTTAMILGRNVGLGAVLQVFGFLLAGLVLLILGRMFSTEGSFALIFAALLHANFIDKVLGSAVKLALILMRKSVMQTTTSLALLAPGADIMSPAFIILGQFDVFSLWKFGVLGLGLSAALEISVKKGLVISYLYWLLQSLVFIGLGFFGRSFMG